MKFIIATTTLCTVTLIAATPVAVPDPSPAWTFASLSPAEKVSQCAIWEQQCDAWQAAADYTPGNIGYCQQASTECQWAALQPLTTTLKAKGAAAPTPAPPAASALPGSLSPAPQSGMLKVHIHHWVREGKDWDIKAWVYNTNNKLIWGPNDLHNGGSGSMWIQGPGLPKLSVFTNSHKKDAFHGKSARVYFHYVGDQGSLNDWNDIHQSDGGYDMANQCVPSSGVHDWHATPEGDGGYRDFDCYFSASCGPQNCD